MYDTPFSVGKITLTDPLSAAVFIYGTLLLILLLSIKKSSPNEDLFCPVNTDQLKGIAILIIMMSHFTSFIVKDTPYYFSRVEGIIGLALFIFLSGYGITRSHEARPSTLLQFILKRVKRIFIPYWAVTALFVLIDYFALKKQYHISTLVLTSLGINLTREAQYIDGGVRWFVTYILMCYVLFLLSTLATRKAAKLVILVAVSIGVFVLNAKFRFFQKIPGAGYFSWNQYFLLFPAGCIVALYYGFFINLWKTLYRRKAVLTVVIALPAAWILILQQYRLILFRKPVIFELATGSIMLGCVVCLLILIGLLSLRNIHIRALSFMGSVSYEVFLLHVFFMAKYNMFFHYLRIEYAFILFLCFIFGVSYLLQLFSRNLNRLIFN